MESQLVGSSVSASVFQIPPFILDDLCSRFIINIPEEERQDLIRIFFQIELAHWFYLDFYCQERDNLKPCGIKEFSTQVFKHCPTLIPHSDNVDKILESWREYKMAVPTYGAILLDPTMHKCLLVQGFWARANWGFPKGKVNEGENPKDCAIREVLEETGFDISDLIDEEEYIEFRMHEQLSRLYIVSGVPLNTTFQPRTRNEIKRLEWFEVHSLPQHKKDTVCKQRHGLNPNAFFMVIPFMGQLRKWIANQLNYATDQSDSDLNSSGHFKSVRTPRSRRSSTPGSVTTTPSDKSWSGRQPQTSDGKLTEFEEYITQKVPREFRDSRARLVSKGSGYGKSSKTAGAPSPKLWKQRSMQAISPKNTHKQKWDHSDKAMKSKRALPMTTSQEKGPHQQRGRNRKKGNLWAPAWEHFHFDVDSILDSMFPKIKS